MSIYRILDLTTSIPLSFPYKFIGEDDNLDLIITTHALSDVHFFSDNIVPSKQNITRRIDSALTRHHLQTLSERVSALEILLKPKPKPKPKRQVASEQSRTNRKYTWQAETEGRSYKIVAESKGGKKSCKWTAEIKDGNDVERRYAFKAVSGGEESESGGSVKREKKEKKQKGGAHGKRVVEIEEVNPDHGTLVLRQAFAKRDRCRGKRKELSPQDAAMMIQMTFKAYLIRRSQALRALRELAVAKAKLKELRVLFNNFSYRRRVSRDAEERQRFTERIIVVLLTVDSIEGADVMVRAAKRSMTDELEAMLDVVDPQPSGKARFAKRRTFDMPDGTIQKELAAGVAEVVQMLDQENGTFEACL